MAFFTTVTDIVNKVHSFEIKIKWCRTPDSNREKADFETAASASCASSAKAGDERREDPGENRVRLIHVLPWCKFEWTRFLTIRNGAHK